VDLQPDDGRELPIRERLTHYEPIPVVRG
jgi:hypothetical protein